MNRKAPLRVGKPINWRFPLDMIPVVEEQRPGDQWLRLIERDLYLLWERWGIERMPRALRMPTPLMRTIERDMPHRFEQAWHIHPNNQGRYGDPRYDRERTPKLLTLYGPIWIIPDNTLPDWMWLHEHYDAWLQRQNRLNELDAIARHYQDRAFGRRERS